RCGADEAALLPIPTWPKPATRAAAQREREIKQRLRSKLCWRTRRKRSLAMCSNSLGAACPQLVSNSTLASPSRRLQDWRIGRSLACVSPHTPTVHRVAAGHQRCPQLRFDSARPKSLLAQTSLSSGFHFSCQMSSEFGPPLGLAGPTKVHPARPLCCPLGKKKETVICVPLLIQ